MTALLLSSWFVLATTMIAAAALITIMIASIDDRYLSPMKQASKMPDLE
jgi:hypothetical protein